MLPCALRDAETPHTLANSVKELMTTRAWEGLCPCDLPSQSDSHPRQAYTSTRFNVFSTEEFVAWQARAEVDFDRAFYPSSRDEVMKRMMESQATCRHSYLSSRGWFRSAVSR